LNFGRKALTALGLSERRALKAAVLFRDHDAALFRKLQPVYGQDERYIEATRASRETMEQLLRAEMDRLGDEEAQEADNDAAGEPPKQAEVG
jgi:glutathione-regulated potassium-efflux system ancillary protein KefC/glutathione-regulated potassium-efflux system protein KefB